MLRMVAGAGQAMAIFTAVRIASMGTVASTAMLASIGRNGLWQYLLHQPPIQLPLRDPASSDSILREPAQAEQQTSQADRKPLSSKDVEVIDLEAMD